MDISKTKSVTVNEKSATLKVMVKAVDGSEVEKLIRLDAKELKKLRDLLNEMDI